MRTGIKLIMLILLLCWVGTNTVSAQLLKVKDGKTAIVKSGPSGDSEVLTRLPAGSVVTKVDDVPRYYRIKYDGGLGWSYKGNLEETEGDAVTLPVNKETLMARSDVLKIIVIDVEVGDATLIICPADKDGNQDVLLIDTGEPGDYDRIKNVLMENGIPLWNKPLTRFYSTHYHSDHMGDAGKVIPLAKEVYDYGDNGITYDYQTAINMPGVTRRKMSISYEEDFSGGVKVECVASNFQTDFDGVADTLGPQSDKNENSVAFVISYGDFDYFTGGDLTQSPEKRLATGIRDVDVYHVNHHGSSATSSRADFVTKLSPEVSVVSNGWKHGHPTKIVGERLVNDVKSQWFQTNYNGQSKAYKPDLKYIADDSNIAAGQNTENPGGNINVVVDTVVGNYYVVMPDLPLNEATFPIEAAP